MAAMAQLFMELHERLQLLKGELDGGKGEDPEQELQRATAVTISLLRIMQVHYHQLVLQCSTLDDEDAQVHQALLRPLQWCLSWYAAYAPLLAQLGPPAALCLAFAAPLLWPSLPAQIAEATRVIKHATAAWRDSATIFITPANLLFARFMLRRLTGFAMAVQLVRWLDPHAYDEGDDGGTIHRPAAAEAEDANAPACAEAFVRQLLALVEVAATSPLLAASSSSSVRFNAAQSELVQSALTLLTCLQQQMMGQHARRLRHIDAQLLQAHSLSAADTNAPHKPTDDSNLAPMNDGDLDRKEEKDGDEENEAGGEHWDTVRSAAGDPVAYPPPLPSLSPRDTPHHYFLRYAPMLLAAADRSAAHAHTWASQAHSRTDSGDVSAYGQPLSFFLRFLRSLVQPLVLLSCKLCSPLHPAMSLALLPPLTSLVEQLARLAPLLPPLLAPLSAASTVTIKQTFESAHPYRPFSDKEIVVSLPPADSPHLESLRHPPVRVSLRFDADRCATHSKYDFVELFAVPSTYKDVRSISEALAAHALGSEGVKKTSATGGATGPLSVVGAPLKGASLSDRWFGSRLAQTWHWPTDELVFENQHVLLHFCTVATTRPAGQKPPTAPHRCSRPAHRPSDCCSL